MRRKRRKSVLRKIRSLDLEIESLDFVCAVFGAGQVLKGIKKMKAPNVRGAPFMMRRRFILLLPIIKIAG